MYLKIARNGDMWLGSAWRGRAGHGEARLGVATQGKGFICFLLKEKENEK